MSLFSNVLDPAKRTHARKTHSAEVQTDRNSAFARSSDSHANDLLARWHVCGEPVSLGSSGGAPSAPHLLQFLQQLLRRLRLRLRLAGGGCCGTGGGCTGVSCGSPAPTVGCSSGYLLRRLPAGAGRGCGWASAGAPGLFLTVRITRCTIPGLSGLPMATKSYFEPAKIAANTSPSGAGPSEIATRSEMFSAPSNSIPVLLRIAVTTLLRLEFSACTVSKPSRNVTTGGTAGPMGRIRRALTTGWRLAAATRGSHSRRCGLRSRLRSWRVTGRAGVGALAGHYGTRGLCLDRAKRSQEHKHPADY